MIRINNGRIKQFYAVILLIIVLFSAPTIYAGPFFYLNSDPWFAYYETNKTLNLYLYTDGETVTAAQAVINFDSDVLTPYSISGISSKCSFWAPVDPSLGYGSTSTPYFYQGNKAAFSCGFSNPGYQSASGSADLIGRITLTPDQVGFTQLTFSNTRAVHISSELNMSQSPTYDLGIYLATSSGISSQDPNATPTPPPTQNITPYAFTPTPRAPDITVDDLTFVEISANSGTGTTTTSDTSSDAVVSATDRDDTIPPPPGNLEPRPNATPFIFKLLDQITGGQQQFPQPTGDILSSQSLRELLIPGKSKADKTVVMINLISTLTFIALLAIVIWRLISITRLNKLKSTHMQELLTSELASIESKLGVIENPQGSQQLKEELADSVQKLSEQLNSTDKKSKK